MSAELVARVRAYLDSHNVITLATAGADGPWAAAVYYVHVGFRLNFLSAPTSRHARNLASRPEVAATIQEDYDDWTAIQGIQLEGRVQRLNDPARAQAIDRYRAKFPVIGPQAPPQVAAALEKSAWYELVPTRLYFIDNTRGLGHRDEVPLP